MANFHFGHIGAAIEAGKMAASHVDIGPINTFESIMSSNDFYNFTSEADVKATIYGQPDDFMWGNKWGNSKSRVVK